MNNNFCYKKGFAKGIDIFNEAQTQGYYSDQTIKRTYERCLGYADKGVKDGSLLTQNQVDYYYGLCDGIRYRAAHFGIVLPVKRLSDFEIYEHEHYYGEKPAKIYY